ncbi:DUF4334 domain-containing protein [uncultured Cellulomonas sp.]|uniref:DUF4334 domain-containing protein n=1 Tax=uncultured Cellulomonas sp. TaxID=189682 RepID=UPI0028E18C17|nr:DUF4334 domain-containing protein [uncultured Cellulomonas sp.]
MTETALERFDTLPAVTTEHLRGLWRGSPVPTGHRLDGVLERLGWFGKRFDDDERVQPLVFRSRRGLTSINPALVPFAVVLRAAPLLRTPVAAGAFAVARPLVSTRRPRARLRDVRYRGVVSAAMVYDDLPVIDAFRAVDDDTVLGAMDCRGMAQPFLFQLHRVGADAHQET